MKPPSADAATDLWRPIGVFDSGVGGLAVLRELRHALPNEALIYVADSAFAPYGERDRESIVERSAIITRFLLEQDVRAVLVACNTATVVAASALRAWCPVPVVAMEPAIKPAAQASQSRRIAVLATRQTVASENVARLVAQHGEACHIELIACPGLVECVERGALEAAETCALLEHFLRPALARGADAVVLGCTHYSFLRPQIAALAGPEVQLFDPAAAVVRQLLRQIGVASPQPAGAAGGERFFTSAAPAAAQPLMSRLWGRPLSVAALASAECGGRVSETATPKR